MSYGFVTGTNTDTDELTIEQLQRENALLKEKNRQLTSRLADLQQHSQSLSYNYIKTSRSPDAMTCDYTGLTKFSLLTWLCCTLHEKLPAKPSKLSVNDRILLVLVKLKLAITNQDIALRFGISVQCVSVVLCTHVNTMANLLKFLVPWPDRDVVNANMPKQCKKNFPHCRVVVDCTEVYSERSKNLQARAQMYSHYKSHSTIKFLVGISPSGAFTYISKCWGGRASDKLITVEDGLLDKMDHGDAVLADRGFLVSEELAVRGVTLITPAFTKGRKQLTPKQVEVSRQISRFRIHVERAIRRLKTYKIMKSQMPISLVRYADSIAVICAALCNLRGRLF